MKYFLCHNSKEKERVKIIQKILAKNEIETWFDEDDLSIGVPWFSELFNTLEECTGILIFFGKSGLGSYQNQEIETVLRKFEKEEKLIIPILLPGFSEEVSLPYFIESQLLHKYNPIDLRKDTGQEIERLIKGLTPVSVNNTSSVELIHQFEEHKSTEKSWNIFHTLWVLMHAIGYLVIFIIVKYLTIPVYALALTIVSTTIVLISLLFVGFYQINNLKIKINREGVITSSIFSLLIFLFLILKVDDINLYEAIGALATITATSIIAGAVAGSSTGLFMGTLAFLGALLGAFVIHDFTSPSTFEIIIGTLTWAFTISLILKKLFKESKIKSHSSNNQSSFII